MARAAKESGFCEEMIKNHDERPTNSFLYNLVMDTYSFGYNSSAYMDMPISHKVFLAQFDAQLKKLQMRVRVLSLEGAQIMLLQTIKNSIHLFIYGDMDVKIDEISKI